MADEPTTTPEKVRVGQLTWVLAGAIALTVIGALLANGENYAAAVGMCLLIAVASAVCGAGLGFLFGVPRVLSREQDAQNSVATIQPGGSTQRPLLETNTNLTKISDHLTTMLVGIALVQLHRIDFYLSRFRDFLDAWARSGTEGAISSPSAGLLPAIGPIVLIIASVCGFLYMYLHTRLVLTPAFKKAEEDLLSVRATAVVASAGVTNRVGMLAASDRPERRYTVEEAIDRMFAALYKPPPQGYQEAITIAGVLANTAAVRRADYWFYKAAAFGQRHHDLLQNAPTSDRTEVRQTVLEAVRQAVRIEPATRTRLKLIASGDGGEDDLIDFKADPDFLKLVA